MRPCLLLLLPLFACEKSDEPVDPPTDEMLQCTDGTEFVDGQCKFICEDDSIVDAEEDCPQTFEPYAVAFFLVGDHQEGELVTSSEEADGPVVVLHLGSLESYTAGATEETCVAGATPVNIINLGTSMPASGEVFASWDMELSLGEDSWSDCADGVSPDTWGADAEMLREAFDGMRIGFGIGPMSAYVGQPVAPSPANYAGYTAMNDLDGNWHGETWATVQILQDVGGTATAVDAIDGAVPNGTIVWQVTWAQDFTDIDFGGL